MIDRLRGPGCRGDGRIWRPLSTTLDDRAQDQPDVPPAPDKGLRLLALTDPGAPMPLTPSHRHPPWLVVAILAMALVPLLWLGILALAITVTLSILAASLGARHTHGPMTHDPPTWSLPGRGRR